MNYIKSFDLFGVSAMQIPCMDGRGAPTTSTPGAVGCLYMDTASQNKDLYKCVGVNGNSYTWVRLMETQISDATTSTNTTWSSSKIKETIESSIANSGIVNATVEGE